MYASSINEMAENNNAGVVRVSCSILIIVAKVFLKSEVTEIQDRIVHCLDPEFQSLQKHINYTKQKSFHVVSLRAGYDQ